MGVRLLIEASLLFIIFTIIFGSICMFMIFDLGGSDSFEIMTAYLICEVIVFTLMITFGYITIYGPYTWSGSGQ